MIRQPKTERDVRAASKTLDHAFVHQLQHDFACSPFESRAILETVYRTFQNQWQTPALVKPWQMIVLAVADHEPEGKPLAEYQMKPVVITLHAPSDDSLRQAGDRQSVARVRRAQIQRIAAEAMSQGAYLTVEDLAERILNCGQRTLVRDLRTLRAQGHTIPLRGQQCDIGRTLTHKVRTIELALQRRTPTQIAAEMHHSLPAIERYLRDFSAVAALLTEGYDVASISFLRQLSPTLVTEYQALYDKLNTPAYRQRLAELCARWGQGSEKKAAPARKTALFQRKKGV